MAQTQAWQAHPPQPGAEDVVHPGPVPPPVHFPAWHVCPAGHTQSWAQVEQSSLRSASQTPLPQALVPPQPPHWSLHSSTHSESQEELQQKGSMAQTQAWQGQPPHPGVGDVVQPAPVPPLTH